MWTPGSANPHLTFLAWCCCVKAFVDSYSIHPNVSGFMRPKEEQTDEQRLLYNLLRGYEKSVRPVRNASNPIVVRLGITLTHLFDLDERNQVLTTMVWLDQEWYDELLTWNPKDYNGLAVLRTPCELLWLPDIVLYNNADDYNNGYMKSKAMVHSDGNVFWPPPTKLRSTCKVDIQYFPFDTQECLMKFGSWSYNGLQVDVTNRTGEVDLKNYVKNGEWELQSIIVERNNKFYTCCPEPFPDVTFKIVIRRKVLYYTYNVVFPCIMMSALTLLVFVLPPDSGEKIALGVTVLLAFSVFMLAIAEKLPETSDSIPLIGVYLTAVMTMTSISVIMTVVVLNVHWRQPEKYQVSEWIKRVFLGKLAYVMCIDTDYNNRYAGDSPAGPPLRLSRHTQLSQDDPEFTRETSVCSIPLQPMSFYEDIHSPAPPFTCSSRHASVIQRRQMFAASSLPFNPHSASLNEDSLTSNHVGRRLLNGGPPRHQRSRSRDRLQDEVVKALSLLIARQEADDNVLRVRKEWRQVAQVMDRCLFWMFCVSTVASTVILLVILPWVGDKSTAFPVEDTL